MRRTTLPLAAAALAAALALGPAPADAACTVRLTVDVPQALRIPGRFVHLMVETRTRLSRSWDRARLVPLGTPAGVQGGGGWMHMPQGPTPGNGQFGPWSSGRFSVEIAGLGCALQRHIRLRFECGYMNPAAYGITGSGRTERTVAIAGGNLHRPRDMRLAAAC